MDVFGTAIDVLFADPHLGQAALWRAGGFGPGAPVRIMIRRPDAVVGFGDARALLPSGLIDVRTSEVSAPAIDDSIEVGGKLYDVIATPRVDTLNLIWTCEAKERS